MPHPRDIIQNFLGIDISDDRKGLRFTLLMKSGSKKHLHMPSDLVEKVILHIHTVATELTKHQIGKRPSPGEMAHATYMEATRAQIGITEDGRTMLRFETKQGVTPHLALPRELSQNLHASLGVHLSQEQADTTQFH